MPTFCSSTSRMIPPPMPTTMLSVSTPTMSNLRFTAARPPDNPPAKVASRSHAGGTVTAPARTALAAVVVTPEGSTLASMLGTVVETNDATAPGTPDVEAEMVAVAACEATTAACAATATSVDALT